MITFVCTDGYMELIGHGVYPAVAPGVAPKEPPACQDKAPENAVFFKCLQSVVRAGRIILAAWRKERGYALSVKPDRKHENVTNYLHLFSPETAAFISRSPLFFKNSSKTVLLMPPQAARATIIISIPTGS